MYDFNRGSLYEWAESGDIHRQLVSSNLISSTTLARFPRDHYDPIFTPIFTTIGLTGTIAGTSVTFASLASYVSTVALSIGLQMLLTPKPPKPEDGKVPLTQAAPFRQWVVGRMRLAGAYMLWEAKGDYLYAVQAVAGHRCQGPTGNYWLHDDPVSIDSSGTTTESNSGAYGTKVKIYHRVGLPTETAYSQVVSGIDKPSVWSNDHRGDGQASMAMICQSVKAKRQSERFPYGAPSLSAEWDGARVWDFRDSAQSPTDPDTWVWSRNAALVLAWHLCFSEFGERKDYTKAILPVLDMWIEEANICDEDVPLAAGGTEKRYLVSGYDTTEHDPKVGTNAILSAMDGWMCYRGDGAILLTVGKFRESRVITLTDRDISGYQIQTDVLPEEECNRLVPKFTNPETGYTEADTDYFEDTAAQLTAGRVLAQEGNYTWCQQWRQARRLGKRDWLRLQQKVKGTIDVRLSGVNAIYARWVRLSTPIGIPSLDGRLIENRRSVIALTKGGFSMDFIQHPNNIDAWTPSVDEGKKPPIPVASDKGELTAPNVVSIVAKNSKAGSVYLEVTVTNPNKEGWSLAVRYRVANDGSGTAGDWVKKEFDDEDFDASGSTITVSTNPVPGDEVLDVQVAWVTSRYKFAWSTLSSITAVSDPTPAGDIVGFSVVGGSGSATFSWTSPNSSNYAGCALYWNTTNNLSTASLLSPIEYGSAKKADSAVRSLTAGVRYAWARSVNRSGVLGTAVASGAFTVT